MKIRVYYEDTDAGGIVYHTNYIKYCERARSEAFFSRGLLPSDGDSSGFVVRKIDAEFLGSASLGDLVSVTNRVKELRGASLTLTQTITRDEKIIFTMDILLAYIQNTRPTRIPQHLRDTLLAL